MTTAAINGPARFFKCGRHWPVRCKLRRFHLPVLQRPRDGLTARLENVEGAVPGKTGHSPFHPDSVSRGSRLKAYGTGI